MAFTAAEFKDSRTSERVDRENLQCWNCVLASYNGFRTDGCGDRSPDAAVEDDNGSVMVGGGQGALG